MPSEFWPHHGSLSKELREHAESMLKDPNIPASVVCTTTLEMGIDIGIGTVATIAQVGIPPSVSGLRQRLGRSGRRGEASVMRIYVEAPVPRNKLPSPAAAATRPAAAVAAAHVPRAAGSAAIGTGVASPLRALAARRSVAIQLIDRAAIGGRRPLAGRSIRRRGPLAAQPHRTKAAHFSKPPEPGSDPSRPCAACRASRYERYCPPLVPTQSACSLNSRDCAGSSFRPLVARGRSNHAQMCRSARALTGVVRASFVVGRALDSTGRCAWPVTSSARAELPDFRNVIEAARAGDKVELHVRRLPH